MFLRKQPNGTQHSFYTGNNEHFLQKTKQNTNTHNPTYQTTTGGEQVYLKTDVEHAMCLPLEPTALLYTFQL